MDILEAIQAIEKINIHSAVSDVIENTSDIMEELQREQFSEGIESTGDLITWKKGIRKDNRYPYTKAYERRKEKLGGDISVVNLNLGQKYWDSIKASISGEDIEFKGTSRLTEFLDENYGNQKYGLTDDNKEKYMETFVPEFIQIIEAQSGFQFN